MSHGLQISASGLMTAMYRQDVFANNLANLDTVGFKPDVPSAAPRDHVRQEDGVLMPSNALLERLGGGTLLNPNRISFTQGSLRTTGSPLDLGIEGDGFLVVQDSSQPAAQSLRLTRDGRLARNANGELVMAGTGYPVLDASNNRIALPARGLVKINADGAVQVDGKTVARLAFIDVRDRESLRKSGHSLFDPGPNGLAGRREATGTLRQGTLEESGVDEVRALLAMTSAAREVEANADLIKAHDRLLERAIASLGRVV
jgi:flagellar basal body rod protein FlgG